MKNNMNGEELISISQETPNILGNEEDGNVVENNLEECLNKDNNKIVEGFETLDILNKNSSEHVLVEDIPSEIDNCSLPKKFKNVESLVVAYNNLQAEFTKRSQKLKELENNKLENHKNIQNAEKATLSEEQVGFNEPEKLPIETIKATPAYEKENWATNVHDFLELHCEAKEFASEISNMILCDSEVSSSVNPLDLAWEKIASKNFVSKKTLSSDTDFLNNYVLTNESLKEQIVKDYLENAQKLKVAPLLIRDNATSHIAISKKPIFYSIKEAGAEVEKLFNN